MNKEIKKLVMSVYTTVLITIFAALVIFWFFSRSFATIHVTPVEATLSIDGGQATQVTNGSLRVNLKPGVHKISIDADKFIGQSQDVEFGRGFSKQITFSLKAVPDPTQITTAGRLLSKGNDFNSAYYLSGDNKTLYKIGVTLDENDTIRIKQNRPITDPRLAGIESIAWSPTGELALFKKGTSAFLFDFMRYDFIHQTETLWANTIGEMAWSPDNTEVAYIYTGNNENSLILSNFTNTSVDRVLDLRDYKINNPILRWSPDSEWIILIPRNADYNENKIYAFSVYSRQIKAITDSGNQIEATFSPDSSKILYSTYSKDPQNSTSSVLSVMKKDGSEKKSLEIRADINKVAWNKDSNNIIVANYNDVTKQEIVYNFNTDQKLQTGFSISNFGSLVIRSLLLTDDNKIILFETNEGIYALKVE
jgi:hypothetical protein